MPHTLRFFCFMLSSSCLFGFGNSICDVAMNVEGTMIEQAVRKSLMTGFHAAFSVGTSIGAILGWLALKASLPVFVHLGVVGVLAAFLIIILSRFVPHGSGKETPGENGEPVPTTKDRMAVWREPRTIMLGVIILGMTFAEGSANDWLPLIMVDGYDTTPTNGTIGYGSFVAAMTIVRAAGGMLLDRFGRVIILRLSAIFAFVGLLIVILAHHYVIGIIGVVLWGGASFGFPVALSAAGDNPKNVAARVSAVATAGYTAFLVGPPLLGMIGNSVGLRLALIAVLVGVTASGLFSKAAKPIDETA